MTNCHFVLFSYCINKWLPGIRIITNTVMLCIVIYYPSEILFDTFYVMILLL